MNSKEEWNTFYNKVGGKYICSECGNILTWFQRDNAGRINRIEIVISFIIVLPLSFVITPLFGGLLLYLYLHNFAKRVGCPICHNKQENIIPLNTKEGIDIFKIKHPEYANLLNNLSYEEEYKNE